MKLTTHLRSFEKMRIACVSMLFIPLFGCESTWVDSVQKMKRNSLTFSVSNRIEQYKLNGSNELNSTLLSQKNYLFDVTIDESNLLIKPLGEKKVFNDKDEVSLNTLITTVDNNDYGLINERSLLGKNCQLNENVKFNHHFPHGIAKFCEEKLLQLQVAIVRNNKTCSFDYSKLLASAGVALPNGKEVTIKEKLTLGASVKLFRGKDAHTAYISRSIANLYQDWPSFKPNQYIHVEDCGQKASLTTLNLRAGHGKIIIN